MDTAKQRDSKRNLSEFYSGGDQLECRLEQTFDGFRFSQSLRANFLIALPTRPRPLQHPF
jgi:hypothetical protein